MSELTIELDRLIQKAALDGALTKEAVDMFHGVLEQNGELKETLERKDRFEVERNKTMERLETDLRIAQGLNKVAAEMEAAIINREQKMTELEVTAKNEKQRVEDHQNMFGLVFRNAVLRNSILGQELVAIPGTPDQIDQYGTRQYNTGREPDVVGVPVSKTGEEEET